MSDRYCARCGRELEQRSVAGALRPACPDDACGFIHFNNPAPVVAGIVQREERVLLIQNEGWPDCWYGLVSGYLESGESPREAMLREIHEELALEGELEGMVGVYPFHRLNQLLLVHHVTVEDEPAAGDELAGLREVPIGRLKPWDFGTGPAPADWLEGRTE